MFKSTNEIPPILRIAVATGFISALALSPLALAAEPTKEKDDAKTITGEVVDMMCYVDHNATGDKHVPALQNASRAVVTVGIVSDGKTYLVVGDHKPMNDQLAEHAGKTITLKGKLAERDGIEARCLRTPRSLKINRPVISQRARSEIDNRIARLFTYGM